MVAYSGVKMYKHFINIKVSLKNFNEQRIPNVNIFNYATEVINKIIHTIYLLSGVVLVTITK